MPAQQTTPPSGLELDFIQLRVEEMAELTEGVEETSVNVKSVRVGTEMAGMVEDGGGGLRSRMDTFAFWDKRR